MTQTHSSDSCERGNTAFSQAYVCIRLHTSACVRGIRSFSQLLFFSQLQNIENQEGGDVFILPIASYKPIASYFSFCQSQSYNTRWPQSAIGQSQATRTANSTRTSNSIFFPSKSSGKKNTILQALHTHTKHTHTRQYCRLPST